ncbi:MAG: hypothetical protein FWD05_07340 [Oscillospiraceae bacterium]|nr:hypothetical protein [Oscillospiraceae bacterium]
MEELVLYRSEFPEPVRSMIKTEKVRLVKIDGGAQLEFITDTDDCPLLGIATDSNLTVDNFITMTREEKELEA